MDRNIGTQTRADANAAVVVALWGGRGSQLGTAVRGLARHVVASPSGAAEDRNPYDPIADTGEAWGGGRPSGRPSTATP
ncbi:hypothetical protein ACFP3U_31930 [Kitasatospora misakiensis]|uniref:Uncharacterized protein n=1 Tax=Kitasatospora misakiensis TaxID=67330 RepID=A0ABW0XCK9_9ACTN